MRTATLFGSSVRAGTLEVLASTAAPLTAYRVAKLVGAQPIQVLTILKSLEPDPVQHSADGWRLVNDGLRRFLRDELDRRDTDRRAEKDELLIRLRLRPRETHGRR